MDDKDREKRLLELKLRMAEESVPDDYPNWRGALLPGIIGAVIGGAGGLLLCSLVKGVSYGMVLTLALLCGAAFAAVAAFRPR